MSTMLRRAALAGASVFLLVGAAAKAGAEQFSAGPGREAGPFIAGQASPAPSGGWQASDDRMLNASVNGQGGWQTITFSSRYDEEIATGTAHSGGHAWRLSNWFHTGLVNPILSPQFTPVGESGATNSDPGGGAAQSNHVVYEFWFRSASTSPDAGSALSTTISDAPGNRMAYLGLFDEPAAVGNGCPGDSACLHVDAVDVTSGNDAAGDGDATFVDHYSPALTRGAWYRARVDATFVDGPGAVTSDPSLCPAATTCHTGNDQIRYQIFDAAGTSVFDVTIGSWEAAYFDGRYGNPVGTVVASDYIGFRVSANPDGGGQSPFDTNSVTNRPHGAYFDDMSVTPDAGSGFSTSFEYDRWVATSGADTGDCSVQASPCRTIGYAVSQANAYDRVQVAAGTYAENVVVDKPLLISGAGAGATTVVPAVFNPDCSAGGGSDSLCSTGTVLASVVFLVQSSDVDISALTVDGINPGIAGHATDIAARNGIMTDFRQNVGYTGFKVHEATVQNIFLRGIYAPSGGGSSEIRNNVVSNVQSDPASIGIFIRTGGGIVDGNTVAGANDAISANFSSGTTFSNNTITDSASGIHTDNNNDVGSNHDEIQGNTVSCGRTDSYGIWTFVPYQNVLVHDNTISACAIGLGAFGGRSDAGPPLTTTFLHNRVDGTGASASSGGTVGALLSTTTFFFGDYDNIAALTGNTIAGFDTGVVTQRTGGKSITTTANLNRIVGNTVGWADDDQNGTGGSSDFVDNWWGCNGGPGATGCDTASGVGSYSPWLVLQASAAPDPVASLSPATITADLTHDSASAVAGSAFPDGTPIAFAATRGAIAPSASTANGDAATNLTGLASAWSTVHVHLDNADVKLIVGVAPAAAVATVNDDTTGTNPDGAATCPTPDFNTISDAIASVPAGATILVCSGEYPENVVVDKNGLVLKGAFAGTAGSDGARGTASEAVIDPVSGIALQVNADHFVFDGFTIQNVADTAIASGGNYGGGSDTVTIANDRVLHVSAGSGLYTNGDPVTGRVWNWTVSNNLFSDIQSAAGSGINLWKATNGVISGNVVTDSAFGGIQVNSGDSVNIAGNSISNIAHNGINVAQSTAVVVSGNTVTAANTSATSDEAGLTLFGGSSDVAFYCNTVEGAGTNGFSTASAISDPLSGIRVFDNAITVNSDISHNLAQDIAIGSNWYGGGAATVGGSHAAGAQVADALAANPIGDPACGDNTAAQIVAVSGSNQHALVTSAFGSPLVARVQDALGGAVAGAPVAFTVPGSGASANLASISGNTDYNGGFSSTAIANNTAGPYGVTLADTNLALAPAAFTLHNEPAPGSITLDAAGLNATYDGSSHAVTATTSPSGLGYTVTYDGSATPPANAGSYNVVATIVDPTYAGSTSGTLTIAKATATVGLSNLSQVYDGSPKSVTVTTNPANLSYSASYNGSATPPSAVGSYGVVVAITDPNYSGAASGVLQITAAPKPDVAVSISSDRSFAQYGKPLSYTIVVRNIGSADAASVTIDAVLPATLLDASWTCLASGAACGAASGSGGLHDVAVLPQGGVLVYTLAATVGSAVNLTTDQITETVTATTTGDSNPADDSASADTQVVIFRNGFEAGGDGAQ